MYLCTHFFSGKNSQIRVFGIFRYKFFLLVFYERHFLFGRILKRKKKLPIRIQRFSKLEKNIIPNFGQNRLMLLN